MRLAGIAQSLATALRVRFHIAATGVLVGVAEAHRMAGTTRVESLHIWPPGDKALMQIGRFGLAYEVGEANEWQVQ